MLRNVPGVTKREFLFLSVSSAHNTFPSWQRLTKDVEYVTFIRNNTEKIRCILSVWPKEINPQLPLLAIEEFLTCDFVRHTHFVRLFALFNNQFPDIYETRSNSDQK